MVAFTKEEYFDILGVYHRAYRNAALAKRTYANLNPDRRQPAAVVFPRIHNRFVLTGSVLTNTRNRDTPAMEDYEDAVLEAVEEEPTTSQRAIGQNVGTCHQTVGRILQKPGYHAYKVSLHQELVDGDRQHRLDFCQYVLAQPDLEELVKNILFCDESSFSSDGEVNRHNSHYYSIQNPHWLKEVQHQGRWSSFFRR